MAVHREASEGSETIKTSETSETAEASKANETIETSETSILDCPFASVAKIVQGKWSMVIIWLLTDSTLRFSELKRAIPHITDANLTKELRALERYGIVHREVYPVVPPKVEYSLTNAGRAFRPVLEALEQWSIRYSPDACE